MHLMQYSENNHITVFGLIKELKIIKQYGAVAAVSTFVLNKYGNMPNTLASMSSLITLVSKSGNIFYVV